MNSYVHMAPFNRGYTKTVIPPVLQPVPSKFEPILTLYRDIINENCPPLMLNHQQRMKSMHFSIRRTGIVLSPSEIQQFMTITNDLDARTPAYRGIFVSALIQHTHNNHYNTFLFNMQGIKPYRYFCSFLNARPELEMMVEGTITTNNKTFPSFILCSQGKYYLEHLDFGEQKIYYLGFSDSSQDVTFEIGLINGKIGFDRNLLSFTNCNYYSPNSFPNWTEHWNHAKARIIEGMKW